ncbi:MAG: vitamin B12-dependent ribonucleotide reductase [Oscillospiraceae bacterium]|nr:vitamin B12-dependent ribonucleotide reductase [Oscillospiraceae bacterium]
MSNLILTDNAREVLNRRYLRHDDDGQPVETPEDMFRRVADTVAAADRLYDTTVDISKVADRFYEMMTNLLFLPNSPTLMNAGRPLGQLSACFVLPIEDSMEGIFETIKQAALIHKSGGGTGFSFSRLRPIGSSVQTTGGIASGPISFLKVFNMATEAVKQGGTRRGANMGILRVDHPDILEFITCKSDNSDITNFNISVAITEQFMKAVEDDTEYPLINPKDNRTVKYLKARDVFWKIVDNAWKNGEPGVVFLDRINQDNTVPSQGEIESTNPCGEQPLLPYESCNLGSLNLGKMVYLKEDGSYDIDTNLLGNTIYDAIHFLDNVIDINNYPLETIAEKTRTTRKIGLGVMGFADMLLYLGIPYDSTAAVAMAEKLMSFINRIAHQASEHLAKTRGAFPLFDVSIYSNGNPIRNGTVTTIAPTGTISIIANASSGIEPIFAYAYTRNVMDNTKLIETNPILLERLTSEGLLTDELMVQIATKGSIAEIEEIPQQIRELFRSAHDIAPEYHLRIQAAFQKHTDNAVSKTVNFANHATREQVAEVFLLAYSLNCKGVTIYRDGSRETQVLTIDKKQPQVIQPERQSHSELPANFGSIRPRPRPEITKGFTERVRTGCGNLYITVNYDKTGICEVFTSTGKGGGCPSQSESTARLVSIAIRSGISVDEIYSQLKGIRCPSTVRIPGLTCVSCPDAIAKVIRKVAQFQESKLNGFDLEQANIIGEPHKNLNLNFSYPNPTKASKDTTAAEGIYEFPDDIEEPVHDNLCPECGSLLEFDGGCIICRNCGYSKCG